MDINNGIAHLKTSDPLLEKVIDEYPVPTLKTAKDLFESLIKYIVYQQLSTSSAKAIYGRLEKYFSSSMSKLFFRLNCKTSPCAKDFEALDKFCKTFKS